MTTDRTGPVVAVAPTPPRRLLARAHRWTTVGLLMVVTLIAFEALAVATVMPVVARALHGLASYGWAFTLFLTGSIVGIVVSGQWNDRAGPVRPLLSGLAVFGVGLVVAGSARSMPVFVTGRAVQGFGAGLVIVAIYVLIARVYDDTMRPRVFAAISGAWVLPSLVGPALAGLVAEHLGWRWVFYGLPPLVLLALGLLVPVLRQVPTSLTVRPGSAGSGRVGSGRVGPGRSRVRFALALALGVGLLQAAGQTRTLVAVVPALVGIALVGWSLLRLLPTGTLRLARGLPAVIGVRGLLTGAFFGAEAFLPLTLSSVHHLTPSMAGLPLTLGATGWFAGSYLQGHRDPVLPRAPLVRRGFLFLVASVAALVLVALPSVTPWLAVPLWGFAGLGMGLAMGTLSVLVLELSAPEQQGASSAALQISDNVGSTLSIGVAGAVLAAFHGAHAGTGTAAVVIFAGMAAVAALGFGLAGRTQVAAAPPDVPTEAGTDYTSAPVSSTI